MVMVTKEIVKAEIENVPEECLEELYEVVKVYTRAEPSEAQKGGGADKSKALGTVDLGDRGRVSQDWNGDNLFSKLRNIKIDGPEDFSQNLDQYLSGEKTIG